MKFIETLILLALVSFTLASNSFAEEKIKIGVSVPLSGAGAAYGSDIKNALLFANKKLFHSSYDLIIEDDQCIDERSGFRCSQISRR